jgi:predicted amidohydrolase
MMSSNSLSVAVCQLTSVDDVSTCVQQIMSLLEQLKGSGVKLVCFPENALFLRLRETDSLPAISLDDPALEEISMWARNENTAVHLGSVPFLKGGRLYNTSFFLTPDGLIRDLYDKIHLFDVDVEGQKRIRESETFSFGAEPVVFEWQGWKFGSAICYDVRFAELFVHYAKQGVDAVLIPAAFLVPTGRAHWEILLRARAIETQAYVLAPAQGGVHRGAQGATRETFGHSMIVDPWGDVVASLHASFGDRRILRATLERDRINKVRAQIPTASHRRL